MIKPTRLFDYIDWQATNSINPKAISSKIDGEWISYSSTDFQTEVTRYSKALLAHNVNVNDKIAIISNNRPEWNFCDNGILQIGAINVPIYPTSSTADFLYILNNAEIKYIFVSDQVIYDKLIGIKNDVPSLIDIISFEPIEGCTHFLQFLEKASESSQEKVDQIKATIKTNDLATIIYTSGTTGNPKGVMLSHKNIIFNIDAVAGEIPIKHGDPVLSFLPLCHIFERVATYVYFSVGVSLYYAESMETLKDNIKEVKPVFFTAVPRLLEKVHAGMIAKSQKLSGFKKIIYLWAVKLAHKPDAKTKFFYSFLDKMIYSKWREALGNNLKGIVTGAAALNAKLDLFFNNIGVPVKEAYGMTEASPGISINRFNSENSRNGTVGPLLDKVAIKLDHREGMADGEGEILIQGDNVMMGYYMNDEATNATIVDGWLYTGDVGKMIEGRFLKITDRVKELFKTSGGKYVAPQYLENRLKESKYIEQVIVIGNNRKFVSAIIFPSIPNLQTWAGYKKLQLDFSKTEWVENNMVNQKIQKEIDRFNIQFSQIEKIKQFKLTNTEWTIDSGELTPTLKLKRKVIEEKNVDLIESMYIN